MALPPTGYGHLRSSTADRDNVVDVLKAAFAEGRLDQDELAERVGLAYRSRTYAELAALTDDLPAGQPGAGLPAPLAGSPPVVRLIPGPACLTARTVVATPPPARRAVPPARNGAQLSGLAIASSILGFGGFVTMGITSPFALVLGIAAMPRLARRGEKGAAFICLGIVLGLIGTLLILLPELLMGRLLP
jgi:Domain of unknown function (DUF1707)/Domain of unknown function (DUF4190)